MPAPLNPNDTRVRIQPVGRAGMKSLDDVRMIELQGKLGLALKTRQRFGLLGVDGGQNLDRDRHAELLVRRLVDAGVAGGDIVEIG